VPPSDVINTLALVAPLAFLAPWLAGRAAIRSWAGRPEVRVLAVAALPLLPLVWFLPAGDSGLGAHRDWDLSALAGLTLTLLGAQTVVLSQHRDCATLAWTLPVLVLKRRLDPRPFLSREPPCAQALLEVHPRCTPRISPRSTSISGGDHGSPGRLGALRAGLCAIQLARPRRSPRSLGAGGRSGAAPLGADGRQDR
jgi:hypothetical protein